MYRPSEEDFLLAGSHSDEPMNRPDHKSKRHPHPRRNEKVGGGHFVFKRGSRTGRIETAPHRFAGGIPFEHATLESALDEAARLSIEKGGNFEVFSRVGGAECRTNA